MRSCSRSPTSCSRSPIACSSSVRLCSLASSCWRVASSAWLGMRVSSTIAWQVPELLGRNGPADPEPLGVINPHRAKLVQRRLVLDTLRDGLDPELVCDPDDRLYDLPILLVAEQVPDELDVDLEVVDGQLHQLGDAP